jgi:hypothetical protein
MEGSIETCDGRNSRKDATRFPDPFEGWRKVQWSQIDQPFELSDYLFVDADARGETAPAMNYAVTDRIGRPVGRHRGHLTGVRDILTLNQLIVVPQDPQLEPTRSCIYDKGPHGSLSGARSSR